MKDSRNLLICLALACVTGFAIFQNYQINRLQMVNQLTVEARHLTDDSFKELFYATMANIRDNQLESIKNTGKVEGMLAVISNQKPADSEHSALWHAGYYRGIDQQNEVAIMAYEEGYHKACDDVSCPANNRPSSAQIQSKNPYASAPKSEEVQPISNNTKGVEIKKVEPNKPTQNNIKPTIKNEKSTTNTNQSK